MQDWTLGTAIPSPHNGGTMIGGPPRMVWHTYEAPPSELSATAGATALIRAGNEVHFVLNPISGAIVQILPANVAGRGLINRAGGSQTNRLGTYCLQVEVIAYASHPFTDYITTEGRHAIDRLMRFTRARGIPDIWPAGPPPRYPGGYDPRSVRTWLHRAGHYGHSQVPENDHGDPGAIDTNRLITQKQGNGMDLYEDDAHRVWDIGPVGRRYIPYPAIVNAWLAKGNVLTHIPDKEMSTIPIIPGDGIPPTLAVTAESLVDLIAQRLARTTPTTTILPTQ